MYFALYTSWLVKIASKETKSRSGNSFILQWEGKQSATLKDVLIFLLYLFSRSFFILPGVYKNYSPHCIFTVLLEYGYAVTFFFVIIPEIDPRMWGWGLRVILVVILLDFSLILNFSMFLSNCLVMCPFRFLSSFPLLNFNYLSNPLIKPTPSHIYILLFENFIHSVIHHK